ncbi:MAG: hypothetical protein Q8R30_00260 [bacterium]|nr:hypothetical protein [bacterium]
MRTIRKECAMFTPSVIPFMITFIAFTAAMMVQMTDRYLNPKLVIVRQR